VCWATANRYGPLEDSDAGFAQLASGWLNISLTSVTVESLYSYDSHSEFEQINGMRLCDSVHVQVTTVTGC